MKFVIATNNKKKLAELKRILSPLGFEVMTARDISVELPEADENGTTFTENSYIKAKSAFDFLQGVYCVVADDSGLCVDALDGRPGVYSARYGGEGLSDCERVDKLLDEMNEVPKDKRNAHFSCVITAIMTDNTVIVSEGICEGEIGSSPIGEGGFGYDPVFMVGERSFSQFSDEEKDEYSHRGKALRLFKDKLQKYLEEKQC